MWSIALLCALATGHPHHGLSNSGGKKVVAAETPEIECPTQQPTQKHTRSPDVTTTTLPAGCPASQCRHRSQGFCDFGPVDTPFELMTPDAAREGCGLSEDTANHLANIDYDQVMCPFGVLVIASKEVPANNVKFAANVIAELLDLDQDGVADVPAVQKALQVGSKTAAVFLIAPNDNDDETFSDVLNDATGFPNVLGSQSQDSYNIMTAQRTYFHEIHHLVHTQGWASVWPEIFGG